MVFTMEKITFPVVLNYNRQELLVTFSPLFLFLFLSDLSLIVSPPPYIDKFSTFNLPAVLPPIGFSWILFLFFIGFPPFFYPETGLLGVFSLFRLFHMYLMWQRLGRVPLINAEVKISATLICLEGLPRLYLGTPWTICVHYLK